MQDYRRFFDLTDRTAVVIGAASGIGQASAHALGSLAEHTLSAHGRIDIAAAAPALNIRKLLVDCTDEEFDQVVNLNLKGIEFVMRNS